MPDLHQPTMRRLYDELRRECQVDSRFEGAFGAGFASGLNRAIDVLVRMNGGFAPAATESSGNDGGEHG